MHQPVPSDWGEICDEVKGVLMTIHRTIAAYDCGWEMKREVFESQSFKYLEDVCDTNNMDYAYNYSLSQYSWSISVWLTSKIEGVGHLSKEVFWGAFLTQEKIPHDWATEGF